MDPHPAPGRFLARMLLKALLLFVIANLLFAAAGPLPALGRLSLYNRAFPGRQRLPYGDVPARAYNLSLYNLEAMFASHELAGGPKPADEFRVLLVGDSATWGWLLAAPDTLSAQLNNLQLTAPDGRRMRFYNLGYPVMSLTKDLLLIERAMAYQPDLLVWQITLESLPRDKQLYPPLLQNNPQAVQQLLARAGLDLPEAQPGAPGLARRSFYDRTLLGARRPLADLLRLQLYGVMWAATGIDQDLPGEYTPVQQDYPPDASFHGLQPPDLPAGDLALDVLRAGVRLAGDTPLLLINEPMYISSGKNSAIRYNFFYPRWAYDAYRRLMAETSAAEGWTYRDFWNLVPPAEFTNSAVHLSPAGSRLLAAQVARSIQEMLAPPGP